MTLVLWRELYLHSFQDAYAEIDVWTVAAAAKACDDELREKVMRLRRDMMQLERDLIMNGLCSPILVDDFAKISINNGDK